MIDQEGCRYIHKKILEQYYSYSQQHNPNAGQPSDEIVHMLNHDKAQQEPQRNIGAQPDMGRCNCKYVKDKRLLKTIKSSVIEKKRYYSVQI